jgi:hypothetical protein
LVRDHIGREDEDKEPGPSPQDREHRGGNEEDGPVRPDPGEKHKQPVEPADAMVDDPSLEVPVCRDQCPCR